MRNRWPNPLTALLLIIMLFSAPAVHAEEADGPALAAQIAEAYGFERWDEVEELRFTFNVKTPDREVERVWTWKPKTQEVTLGMKDADPVTYRWDELGDDTPDEIVKADRRFINDSYWLLYPFQLMWSKPAATDAGVQPLPIGDGEGRKLITQYPDAGGYTPGDAYDLYLDGNHLITHWVFRKGGGENGRAMTWESNVDLGPITVCTDHRNADNTFRLWFTGLSVTTTDGETFKVE
jgi:hypothetical protein